MRTLEITAFDLAQRFVGLREVAGVASNPEVLAMLRLDQAWPEGDEVPWCSAFVNSVCHLLRLPRSHDLRARSWLSVGKSIASLRAAEVGVDVVVLSRGEGPQPGSEGIAAPGHVGFFAGYEQPFMLLLGGNQRDEVRVAPFPLSRLLGIRRLLG